MESAPSIFTSVQKPGNNIKSFELKLNDKIYILTISLMTATGPKDDKILTFNLKEKNPSNNLKYYESNQKLNDLAKLFLININKYPNIDDIIFTKIENFHSKNNVILSKDDNNQDIINLIYVHKIIDDDDYEIKIELKEKNSKSNENELLKLSKSFTSLTKEFEEMKISFEKKLKEKEEENISLRKLQGQKKL